MEAVTFDDFIVVEHEAMVRLATSLVDTRSAPRDRAGRVRKDVVRVAAGGPAGRVSACGGGERLAPRTPPPSGGAQEHAAETPWCDGRREADLLDALSKLLPQRRIASTLRFYADLPEAETARLMNVCRYQGSDARVNSLRGPRARVCRSDKPIG